MRGLICLASPDRVERGIKPRRVDYAARVSLALFTQTIRLARYGGHRAAVDHRSLASIGLADLLAPEVQGGPTTDSAGAAQPDSPDGDENPLWGEERIANELLVKLGIRVSPRTVGKYMPKRPPGQPRGDQRWSTFLKNHAKAILACDFFVAVTATFRMLYVFVVIEHGTRRLAHVNVTANPTADWTLQQLREVVGNGGGHRYLIHDRDQIFAKHLDDSIRALGVEVLRSPVASPKANAHLRARDRNSAARMLRLADSDVRSASTCDSQMLGDPLQRRTSSQRVGTRCAGSSGEAWGHPEARRPAIVWRRTRSSL